ncbi:MAG: hypothetical protein WC755_02205 [Candidatus Woesearchaeota archaeon]|jgi:CMP-N-acetylneuraminic acid synthetase
MKRINDISMVINARVGSTRTHHKLIRPFYKNNTLLDLALLKLSKLDMENKFLAIAEEKELLDIYGKYKNSDIQILHRKKESVESYLADQKIIFEHYKCIKTPFIMSINPCSPFTSIKTYKNAINYFVENEYIKTLTSVKIRKNIFLNNKFEPINVKGNLVDTQFNDIVYEFAHLFHIFDKEYFEKTGTFWDYTCNNPGYFLVDDQLELLDIDEENEFLMISSIYNYYQEKGV